MKEQHQTPMIRSDRQPVQCSCIEGEAGTGKSAWYGGRKEHAFIQADEVLSADNTAQQSLGSIRRFRIRTLKPDTGNPVFVLLRHGSNISLS